MNAREERWIGRDLRPLPYESSLSIVWRFAWCNSLGYPQLLRYIGNRWLKHSILCAAQRVQSVMGWDTLHDAEEALYEQFSRDVDVWIERRFRYCPLCLEHGYHSVFHQMKPLACCPVHQVELMTRCYACGEPLPEYRSSRDLLLKPYRCPACGSPISGVAPNLSALHLPFRQTEAQLVKAFRLLETWWHRTESVRQEVAQFSSLGTWFYRTCSGDWCDRDAFVRDLCCAMTQVPPEFSNCRYRHFTILNYCLTAQETLVLDPFYPENWCYDSARVETVYRATLRFLERWLTQFDIISQADYERHAAFAVIDTEHGKCIDVQGFQPRLFALILLRWQLECGFGPSQLLPPRQAKLYRTRFLDNYEVRRDTPRLTWRAVFLGMYAAWYHHVEAAQRHGQPMELANLSWGNAAHVFSYYSRWQDEVWQETVSGRVTFPSVEGLDALLRGRTGRTTRLVGDQHPPFVELEQQPVSMRARVSDTVLRIKDTHTASTHQAVSATPPTPQLWEDRQLGLPFGDE